MVPPFPQRHPMSARRGGERHLNAGRSSTDDADAPDRARRRMRLILVSGSRIDRAKSAPAALLPAETSVTTDAGQHIINLAVDNLVRQFGVGEERPGQS